MHAAEIGDLKTVHDSVVVDSQIKRALWPQQLKKASQNILFI